MLGKLVILLLAMYVVNSQLGLGPTDATNIRSYHLKKDNIPELLNRLEWTLLRDNRVDYVGRYLMWGLWITFISSFLMLGELPESGLFLRTWLVITVIISSLHGYYYWHADKFSSHAGLGTLETLRSRIGVEKGNVETQNTMDEETPGYSAPWTFTHLDYSFGTRFPY